MSLVSTNRQQLLVPRTGVVKTVGGKGR